MHITEFEAELVPHAAALLRLARRLSRHDADDLVQETWVRALAARHRYTPGTNGRAWLMRILCNLAVSEQRRRARDERLRGRVLAREVTPAIIDPTPEAGIDAPVDDAAVTRALDALAPAERRLIELADVNELSYREIAATLACPIGTVMSRLHRARRRLRSAAGEQLRAAEAAAPAPSAQTESRLAAA
jgi:RNA polymerase sigma-70 factor, ECF subfamily